VVNPEVSLSQAFDSAIRYVVGHSEMDEVLTEGREVARQRVLEELQGIIAPYNMGVDIIDLNFTNARPPEEVRAAFDDAIAAQEDEQRLLPQYESAPEVTRQRIYLETLESVFSSTSKIMVDTEGGGNIMYLPLDKIMEQRDTSRQTINRNSTSFEEIRDRVNNNTMAPVLNNDSRQSTSGRQGRN